MSKVKKEPGYAGLILIYDLILILRMLHIASLDKLFNKKYRFYFLYVPVGFILYYTFFFPFMHVQVVGNEGQDLLRTFFLTFLSIYILWFTISALSTIYFMVEPKLTRYAENMFKECELYINKKTTARKIVIRLRNLVDGYYIPFGIASITIGIGLFIFYQTLTYSFKTIEGAFHNFVALQFICAGICWMIRREYGNEEHRKKTKQEKKQEEKEDHFYEEELEEITSNDKEEVHKKKNSIKKDIKKNDFRTKRKEMYKHKEKLQSNTNTNSDDVVAYKENMTVAELAGALNVPAATLIKKLMALGMLVNINASLDFDTAEILVADFNKTLKKESTNGLSYSSSFTTCYISFSLRAAASVLGKSPHAAEMLVCRARSALKKQLEQEGFVYENL